MLNKVIITSAIALICIAATAQDRTVAVFDPAGELNSSIREIVREEICSIIVNASGYTLLERQLVNKALEESRLQPGALIDDSQAGEAGRRMGANLVMVTNVTAIDGDSYYISCKLIDVETKRTESQRTATVERRTGDLLNAVQKAAGEMVGVAPTTTTQQPETVRINDDLTASATAGNMLFEKSGIIFTGGKLKKHEVRKFMASNRYALTLYERGRANKITGNLLIIPGGYGFLVKPHAKIDIRESVNMYNSYPVLNAPDGLLISRGCMIHAYSESNTMVNGKGKTVYKYGKSERLSKDKVRELMADNGKALLLYNRGTSLNKWGNIMLIGAPCVFIAGAFVASSSDWWQRYKYKGSDGNIYYGYSGFDYESLGLGICLTGAAMILTAPVLKLTGISSVKKAVNTYNGSLNTVSARELKFDFTGNGVRLALTF